MNHHHYHNYHHQHHHQNHFTSLYHHHHHHIIIIIIFITLHLFIITHHHYNLNTNLASILYEMLSFAYKFGDQVIIDDYSDSMNNSSSSQLLSQHSNSRFVTPFSSSEGDNKSEMKFESIIIPHDDDDYNQRGQLTSRLHHPSDNVIQLPDQKGIIIYPCLSNTLKDTQNSVSKDSINKLLCSVLQVRVNDDGIQLSVK